MPRPAGRRWERLRRSSSRATKVLSLGIRGRRRDTAATTTHAGTQVVYPQPERTRPLPRVRRPSGRQVGSALTADLVGLARSLGMANQSAPARPVPEVDEPSPTIPLLPGERTLARQVKFAIANGCTVASLLIGMGAIFLALHGEFRLAALALLACVVFDGCDGGLARKFGVVSPFGAQMDSLADLSSFGVATGVVTFEWLVADGISPMLAGPACALIAVCAAIRLARFNVSPKNGQFFCGVPTTMVAAVLSLDVLIGPHLPAGMQVLAVVVYALAMVSSFPYAKLVRVVRLPLWFWVLPAICAMISVPGTFALVVGAYLVSGPARWVVRNRRRLTARPA